jgi:hypothetical protein
VPVVRHPAPLNLRTREPRVPADLLVRWSPENAREREKSAKRTPVGAPAFGCKFPCEWPIRGDLSRWRWVTGVGVVAALAGALIFLSLQRGGDPVASTTSLSTSVVVSTTDEMEVTTTAEPALTTTTSEAQRRAEVEELLRDLWFGWFDAIYRKDPDALWQVVATTRFHDSGVAAMETLGFTSEPQADSFHIRSTDVLLDRSDCIVVYYELDASDLVGQPAAPFVSVLWPDPRYGFRFATDWQYINDLWLQDCDNLEREETP